MYVKRELEDRIRKYLAKPEILAVVGARQSGKTTLLKILSRITYPTKGEICLRGRVASLLEVGTGFHPELTGRENIYFNGSILGMKKQEIDKKFDEIVSFAEVEKFIDTPVKRYSSGMQVRLAFAVAAHLEPEILLIDEVLAVGDTAFQKKCLGKMEDVANKGRTIFFVSHNMAAIERLCTKAILLDGGKIVQIGPVNQVINTYLSSKLYQAGERIWTDSKLAPGNDIVRLKAVRAVNTKGEVMNEFRMNESFYIELEFIVLSNDYLLNASFYFYDRNGNLIFFTGDFQDAKWQNSPRPIGIHRSRCFIPENFLNEGTASILVGVSTNPNLLHAVERDAIIIKIVDDFQEGGARGNYTRSWPGGTVRPLLKWSFEFEPLQEKK